MLLLPFRYASAPNFSFTLSSYPYKAFKLSAVSSWLADLRVWDMHCSYCMMLVFLS